MSGRRGALSLPAAAPLAALALAACGPSGMARSASAVQSPDGQYVQQNLVSDGFVAAKLLDPACPGSCNLVNGWGIAALPTSPWWVSDNGSGKATLYDGDGNPQALVVSIPGAGGAPGAPTGVVANTLGAFPVTLGTTTAAARFIFAGEDGTIAAWTLTTPPSTTAALVADESASSAVFKGIALAPTSAGPRLYVTNFRAAKVEIFDGSFMPVSAPGAFTDPGIPAGFAPFGIRAIGDVVYVTYAKQDAARHDDVAGKHLGYVSAFSTDGTFLRRVASRGKLNSPWGLALAPADFGPHSNRLLVGNFGDGHIVSYALSPADDGEDDDAGTYLTAKGGRVTIDGLWGLSFGNGARAGPTNALFFAAGPGGEAHGLFGRIDFVPSTE